MSYRLASRENIDSDKFDLWPAVLDRSFTKFNNRIEPFVFNTEDEILRWLDSRCKAKISERTTNVQEFRNGDPNRLYSVYRCEHNGNTNHSNSEDGLFDKFLYSLRVKKPAEAFMTYSNDKGERVKSSFKKLDSKIEFSNVDEEIDYSSDVRLINGEFYEGIYPIDEDEKDRTHLRYLDFVKTVHDSDPNGEKEEFSIVFANSGYAVRWLDKFTKKLEVVQRYLEFFAKGGDAYVSIEKDDEHDTMIRYIFKTLSDNRLDTPEDDLMQLNVRNMVIDPYLCNNEIYQIRYQRTLLSWHKNYVHIIKKLGLMPSKQFADTIMNFSLMDFFKQIHSRENLEAIIKNIEMVYGVQAKKVEPDGNIRVIGRFRSDAPKFHKVVKTFSSNNSLKESDSMNQTNHTNQVNRSQPFQEPVMSQSSQLRSVQPTKTNSN
ncbi:hypothetical protein YASMINEVIRUS_1059 [Yasminevirus sp. GU-2018]|uniref:Uncharacterized protein n=1 Tax=Yasminevirus sp. GU-2018 TaxID=2420051 RepID=A0A5K0UBR8_9VIRU|nr:hypothetical protein YASMINEVIRUS_1059 [Yasminevirus sp. GU-2018]